MGRSTGLDGEQPSSNGNGSWFRSVIGRCCCHILWHGGAAQVAMLMFVSGVSNLSLGKLGESGSSIVTGWWIIVGGLVAGESTRGVWYIKL